MEAVNVIGGGLAGSEAAWQIAQAGIKVKLWEMRPVVPTPVHQTDHLAELVCSNSLKSALPDTAQGLLKNEMRILGSLTLACAEEARVPAGSALAVDREIFSSLVTKRLASHPQVEIIRQEVKTIPRGGVNIIATGPLTAGGIFEDMAQLTGADNLYFYDAIAPSVTLNSLNPHKIFRASRYGKGNDDYINCPLNKEEYENFWQSLVDADTAAGHDIDKKMFFDGCMPIEVIARRGIDTLRYGPMRPVGLIDPRTERRAWAVVQLRQENQAGTVYGLVGFQTRLKWGEQDRVFRMIPGLENAEFVRYGVMHRNTYINSPRTMQKTLQYKNDPGIFLAGQITGVEGYMESAATGILAGINAVRYIRNQHPVSLSSYTMLGALVDFICHSNPDDFQPMNANFGILPPLDNKVKDKRLRYQQYVQRSEREMSKFSELYLQ
ncbi:Folate-dependent ribothymidyl synthase [Syntrophomonas zehnderi OL-4]|uniref:Methylenetetrahydrofolate--tRNA-(uracil-5-)-methyltransferase TrmFO n=1 Tax=Syntrophomonas zehnderi OL-4 TaxID=690567 RepID=A0A0E4C8R4_9FIRM|nr:methylenetetrahydrofolate--tRNA-(uracil(54)-C(5))-methyltransferase (FADH(2)-oxidizing) TrmFO [Syntrophomonas zehnderi]CFX64196.1 Folate-dependent ribothymidyl synthase [Syntrophomonas zehnderi OL-4]